MHIVVLFAILVSGCADPKTASECVELAGERFNRQDYSTALRLCDRAIELDPDNCSGYNMRAIVHQVLGNSQKSLADCARAIDAKQQSLIRGSGHVISCCPTSGIAIGAKTQLIPVAGGSVGAMLPLKEQLVISVTT